MITVLSIKTVFDKLNALLAEEKYDSLFELDRDKLWPPDKILEELFSRGRRFSIPPEGEFNTIEIYPSTKFEGAAIEYYLWIDGVKSNLVVSVNIYRLGE